MADALQWLRRSCGKWRSERRYIFNATGKPVNLTTLMDIFEGERGNEFVVEWSGKTSGKLEITLEGDTLRRSRDYFGDKAHDSKVEMLSNDIFRTTTTYDDVTYVETIELLSEDQYRLRQTFGTNPDGSFALVGQYCEFRQPDA